MQSLNNCREYKKKPLLLKLMPMFMSIAVLLNLFIGSGCSTAKKEKPMVKNETQTPAKPVPPTAEKIKKELTLHQHTRIDNYYWIKQRENPKVMDYLKAENDYLKAVMKHTEDLQETLFKEIVGRIKQVDTSVPYKYNRYYYYRRYEKGKEYRVYCRKKGSMKGKEEILLNVNQMAKGHAFYNVSGDFSISPDNKIIAYGVDTVSRRIFTLHFKNLVTGEMSSEEIPDTTGGSAWANDNKTVFYTIKDKTLREYKIFKHRLGSPVSEDKEVFHEADDAFATYVYKSKSKKYIIIRSSSLQSNECRFLEADNPAGEFKIIEPRQKDHEYSVDHYRDKFYIRTNLNAKNFRLMETPVDKAAKENWTEVIPHREDVLLESFEVFKDFLVVNERNKGLPCLRIITWDKKDDHYIDFGEETYMVYLSANPEFNTGWLRYVYSSLTTPHSTFDYNMNSKEKKLLKQREVVGDFDPKNYKAERLFAAAAGGTKVPISLVYKKGLKKNGNNPLVLYAYGAYGYSVDPNFNSVRLCLLDRGFVYAIAHIRGGQEMGRYWYEEGKLLKKKNTFTDFIACAEHLVAEKFTTPAKLFANGGSAGGLLMGAVLNMRPDLFKGVIADVPFVDVITTMLDESIPLTTSEYSEWGNPAEKNYYDYMLSYSPYDNVQAKNYPAILVASGLHDSQVQYWEPAKWVAKLRELKTDTNILLLYTNMDTGHDGASGRFTRYRETALKIAFILDQLGIKN